MYLLSQLKWAVGLFIVVFVVWQIVVPMLQGNVPFKASRNKKEKK